MQQIAYDHGKLAGTLAGSAAMAMLSLLAAWSIGSAVVLVVAGFFALCGGAAAHALVVGRPALRFDAQQITVNTLVSSTTLPWSQVRDIRLESLVLTMYGFIPMGRTEYIVFHVAGGMLGTRKVRVSSKLLDRSRGIAEICALLGAARLKADAGGGVGFASAGTTTPGADGEAGGGAFDPDAAVARYLARKAQEEASSAAAQPASPPQPQRPVFGRKQV